MRNTFTKKMFIWYQIRKSSTVKDIVIIRTFMCWYKLYWIYIFSVNQCLGLMFCKWLHWGWFSISFISKDTFLSSNGCLTAAFFYNMSIWEYPRTTLRNYDHLGISQEDNIKIQQKEWYLRSSCFAQKTLTNWKKILKHKIFIVLPFNNDSSLYQRHRNVAAVLLNMRQITQLIHMEG